jgi:hypothetical protein
MRQPEATDQRASPLQAQQAVRKPYRKPAVRHEQVFETRALSCGKVNVTQGSCHFERKTS